MTGPDVSEPESAVKLGVLYTRVANLSANFNERGIDLILCKMCDFFLFKKQKLNEI